MPPLLPWSECDREGVWDVTALSTPVSNVIASLTFGKLRLEVLKAVRAEAELRL